jgi:SAM-dependent methyltransferase
MNSEAHWTKVYETRTPDRLSWYQRSPERSIAFIRKLTSPSMRVIDVGGGASSLVDALLELGYERPLVLDVSAVALARAKERLGARSELVDWRVANILSQPVLPQVDLWHDRAVFHFLTNAAEQATYASLAAHCVRTGGHLVLATFAPDGPEKCSGLPVQRHDGVSLERSFDKAFELVAEEREVHLTPAGAEQRFTWVALRRRSLSSS